MSDLEAVRKRWLADRPSFVCFADEIVLRLKAGLKEEGLWGEVSGRAKEMDSLIRKLIKKPDHTYESLSDKCGIRVIVRCQADIDPVLGLAERLFERGVPENKGSLLAHDKVGYLSTHANVTLYKTDPSAAKWPSGTFYAELQVRTLAQHLWSEMSHDTVYKSDETLICVPNELKRRVFLLAATIEVADNEFSRLNREMRQAPEIEIFQSLERHYYKLTTRRGDVDMSLSTIKWLYPLYGLDPQKIKVQLDGFWDQRGEDLRSIYGNAELDDSERSAFLFQPEALMICDLLCSKVWEIRQAWADHQYPERELERIANAIGVSFDA